MNEKIKELYQQAVMHGFNNRFTETPGMAIKPLQEVFVEKFAELIVDECIKQIIEKGTDWVDFAPSQTGVRPEVWAMAQHIKKHFGE